jgi:hypothetical protein
MGWFNNGLVLGVFETSKKMVQIVSDTAGRFVHKARDLANRHRISIQHSN